MGRWSRLEIGLLAASFIISFIWKDANLKRQARPAYSLLYFGPTFMKEVKMDDELIYKRDALIKRRAELIEEIAARSDAIAIIDTELQQDS